MNTPLNSEQVTGITAGARRMRAHRQRRREGLRCVTLDLRDDEIERLIGLGHLRQDDRKDKKPGLLGQDAGKDKNAVLLALSQFLDGSALGGAHREFPDLPRAADERSFATPSRV